MHGQICDCFTTVGDMSCSRNICSRNICSRNRQMKRINKWVVNVHSHIHVALWWWPTVSHQWRRSKAFCRMMVKVTRQATTELIQFRQISQFLFYRQITETVQMSGICFIIKQMKEKHSLSMYRYYVHACEYLHSSRSFSSFSGHIIDHNWIVGLS